MRKIMVISCALLTGCGIFITRDNVKYASNSALCSMVDGFATDETKAIAYEELTRRGTQNDCDAYAESRRAASLQLMQTGNQMMQQSQPRALVSPPRQTTCWQAGIYVNCNQY